VIITALLTTIAQLALANMLVPTWKVPPFTMPFNLLLLSVLLGAYAYDYVDLPASAVGVDVVASAVNVEIEWNTADFFKGALRGISQVYVSPNWIV